MRVLSAILPFLLAPHLVLSLTTVGIPLETFQSMLNSDLDHLSPADALNSYNVEHRRALEQSSDTKYPFLICNSDGAQGFDRKRTFQQLIDESALVVNNKAEMSCFFAPLVPQQVEDLDSSSSEYFIQPLTGSMKVKRGTVDIIESYSVDDEKSLGVVLCSDLPGDSISLPSMALPEQSIGRLIIEDIKEQLQNRRLRRGMSPITFLDEELKHDRALMWQRNLEVGFAADHGCESMLEELAITKSSSTVINYNFGTGAASDASSSANPACLISLVAALSSHPKVCTVDAIKQDRPHNTNAQWLVQSGVLNERPFWDAGISGSQQIVQVSDSGLDTDHCFFWDSTPGEQRDGSIQLDRRKIVLYEDYMDSTDYSAGHGSHVVGSIVGKQSIDGTVLGETGGVDEGIAKDAKVAFFDVGLGKTCCYVPPPADLFDAGRRAGAKIGNASWGNGDNSYSSTIQAFDEYLYLHDDFLFFSSAGNQGEGDKKNTVGSRGVGKNLVAVGASTNSAGPSNLAYFSSRGPSEDGRIKPDIVAPGKFVSSARSDSDVVGECGNNMPLQGTSMASPVAAGSAALVRQYFLDGFYPTGSKVPGDSLSPSSALVKAVLINGAQSLVEVEDTGTDIHFYDEHQGFGQLNLISSLHLAGKNDIDCEVHDTAIERSEAPHVYSFVTGNCSVSEVSATLVWTDQPGAPGCVNGNCLINDLDLVVFKNGTPSHPNGLDGADHTNNVERVRLQVSQGDSILVQVQVSNLMTDKQKYALVVTGCLEAPPTPSPPPTTLQPTTLPPTPSPTTKSPTKLPTTVPTPVPVKCKTVKTKADCRLEKEACRWNRNKKRCVKRKTQLTRISPAQ